MIPTYLIARMQKRKIEPDMTLHKHTVWVIPIRL
jgi:hypothetical protein